MKNNRRKNPPLPAPIKRNINVYQKPSFGSTIMDGIALGTGSALGHRVMDGIFGPRQLQVSTPNPSNDSTNNHISNNEICKSLLEKYEECITRESYVCVELNELLVKYKCDST